MKRLAWVLVAIVAVVLGFGIVGLALRHHGGLSTGEKIDTYQGQPLEADSPLKDDRIENKSPPFDPATGRKDLDGGGWVNPSSAVLQLDSPPIKADTEQDMLHLHACYGDAITTATLPGRKHLPSVPMVAASVRPLDDAILSALLLADFQGEVKQVDGGPRLVAELRRALDAGSPARPFLGAALKLAGHVVDPPEPDAAAVNRWLTRFKSDAVASRPTGFYTASTDLTRVWRFSRFLQQPFEQAELEVPRDIAAVLSEQPALAARYGGWVEFHARMTSRPTCLLLDALNGSPRSTPLSLSKLAGRHGVRRPVVCILPGSTNPETALFERLAASGVSLDEGIASALARAMGRDRVAPAPEASSGWYSHQAYAMEAFWRPGSIPESQKLLLTARFKRRLFEPFVGRLTSVRDDDATDTTVSARITRRARLRVEPAPTYFLRKARAYRTLADYLRGILGDDGMKSLNGLDYVGSGASTPGLMIPRRPGGGFVTMPWVTASDTPSESLERRATSLDADLTTLVERFHGLCLISCEDIGLAPLPDDTEVANPQAAKRAALAWLAQVAVDPELAQDARHVVPIMSDGDGSGSTRAWGMIGVRLVHLEVVHARGPKTSDAKEGPWETSEEIFESTDYILAVDDCVEFDLAGREGLSRPWFRRICNDGVTREYILKALGVDASEEP